MLKAKKYYDFYREIIVIGFFILFLSSISLAMSASRYSFDIYKPGDKIYSWTFDMVGNNGSPNWAILSDQTDPGKKTVLSQSNLLPQDNTFFLSFWKDGYGCFRPGWYFKISTKMKIVDGTVAKEGGIIYAAKDKENFYALCISAKDNVVILYRFAQGNKEKVVMKDKKIDLGKSYDLSIGIEDGNLVAKLDETVIFTHKDLTCYGGIGLITRADSEVYFYSLGWEARDM